MYVSSEVAVLIQADVKNKLWIYFQLEIVFTKKEHWIQNLLLNNKIVLNYLFLLKKLLRLLLLFQKCKHSLLISFMFILISIAFHCNHPDHHSTIR